MKTIEVIYVVYNAEGDEVEYFKPTNKELAIATASRIKGTIRKRITTVEELEPMDEDYTVWA
jgi:hypothetical protein